MASPHHAEVTSKRRLRRRIAVINQKGGSTKTTTAVNLSAALVKRGRKVRLHDVDPQKGSATFWLPPQNDVGTGMLAVFRDERSLDEATARTTVDGLFIVPSWFDLREVETSRRPGTEIALKAAVEASEALVDYEIFDCTHGLDALAIAGLAAAEELLIPVQASGLDTSGMEELIEMQKLVKKAYVPQLQITSVVVGRTKNTKFDNELIEKYRTDYPKAVVLGIADSVRMRQASKEHKTIDEFEPTGKSSADFAKLAEQIDNWELAA